MTAVRLVRGPSVSFQALPVAILETVHLVMLWLLAIASNFSPLAALMRISITSSWDSFDPGYLILLLPIKPYVNVA